MKNYQIGIAIFSFVTASFLFSCQKSSTNDLHDVQLCLNGATAATAMGCVDKISGDTSAIAYSLRCSAIFISQGFGTAVSFINALDNLNGSGGASNCTSCSSTVTTIAALKFDSAGVSDNTQRQANIDAATEAFAQCSHADAKIYTQIASLFQLGTMTSMLAYSLPITGAGGVPNEHDLQNALLSGTLDPVIVGTVVTITYANTCTDTDKASDSTKAYCAQLKTALDSGATPSAIGDCLIKKVANPSLTCP